MFGRKPKLPIDLTFEKAKGDDIQNNNTNDYIEELKERMEKTQQIVKKHLEKAKIKQKEYYDKRAKAVKISIGDKVLVKKLAFEGKHKIQDKFEDDIYTVVEQSRPDIPVFKVRSDSSDKERTLHRTHLLLVDYQDDIQDSENNIGPEKEKKIIQDASKEEEEVKEDKIECDVTDSESESEDFGIVEITYQHGDAHDPEEIEREMTNDPVEITTHEVINDTDKMTKEVTNEEVIHEDEISEEIPVEYPIPDIESEITEEDSDIGPDSSELQIESDRDESTGMNIVLDERAESEEETESIRSEEVAEGIIEDEITEGNLEVQNGDIEEQITEGAEGDIVQITEKEENTEQIIEEHDNTEEKKAPIPKPRKSERKKKPPDRYGEYVYSLTRPIDNKLHSLDTLMRSGVLNNMDSETAHRIIQSIMSTDSK
jgi:hypothetical protein